jgi:hypothetical protein
MTAYATGRFEEGVGNHGRRCGRFARNPWSVWEIAAIVGGFVVFWPLGLLALFLKWKNGEVWRGASSGDAPWHGFKKPDFDSWMRSRSHGYGGTGRSGNAAFDEYRKAELAKLDEMRRKLEEERSAFHEFVEKLRRAKDQEEFDRFMAERRNTGTNPESPAA